jgi:hypothetical protein
MLFGIQILDKLPPNKTHAADGMGVQGTRKNIKLFELSFARS